MTAMLSLTFNDVAQYFTSNIHNAHMLLSKCCFGTHCSTMTLFINHYNLESVFISSPLFRDGPRGRRVQADGRRAPERIRQQDPRRKPPGNHEADQPVAQQGHLLFQGMEFADHCFGSGLFCFSIILITVNL